MMSSKKRYVNLLLLGAFYAALFVNAKGWYERAHWLISVAQDVDELATMPAIITAFNQEPMLRSSSTDPATSIVAEGPESKHVKERAKATISDAVTSDNPVFVLSLPNSGSLTMDRYFKCAGLDEDSLGRRWSKKNLDKEPLRRIQMGRCISTNARHNATNPLDGCGSYRVWTEMESAQRLINGRRQCFFPSFRPGFLSQLFRVYPNATVLNVAKNPDEWYETLSDTLKERWSKWCNELHDDIFPQTNGTKAEWLNLYENHHKKLRTELQSHTSVRYMEIVLGEDDITTALELEQMLGVEQKCWLEKARHPTRKSDIGLPIFNLGLPKSATSSAHEYLNCGLGGLEGAHQWIVPDNDDKETEHVTVAHCLQHNLQQNRPVLEKCGDTIHFSDIGVLRREGCFYPSMSREWLETMYRDHPHGTIMHVVRDANSWYKSAQKWNGLTKRWSKVCDGFPMRNATEDQWISFYNNHTQHVRDFARNHPTMAYVEFSLENQEEAQQALQEHFGFSDSCWGHKNNNYDGSSVSKRMHRTLKEAS